MTVPEENTYRQEMYSLKGEIPAGAILGRESVLNTGFAVYSIDRYVQGNTLLEALTLLSRTLTTTRTWRHRTARVLQRPICLMASSHCPTGPAH